MIRQKLADSKPNMETLRQGIRDARLGVRTALIAEPFDQAKVNDALESVVQAEANEKRAKVAVFADTVSQLTPEERRQLHDWLEKKRPLR
jgi:Spy/CpxP family protein refolding chaperone